MKKHKCEIKSSGSINRYEHKGYSGGVLVNALSRDHTSAQGKRTEYQSILLEVGGSSGHSFLLAAEAARDGVSGAVTNGDAGGGRALVPEGWAACEKKEPEPKESGICIEIGEYRVKVGGEVRGEQLETVCRVLMRLC